MNPLTKKKKRGRKATGRIRKPLNITLPNPLRREIERRAFKSGISISKWLENLADRELGISTGSNAAQV